MSSGGSKTGKFDRCGVPQSGKYCKRQAVDEPNDLGMGMSGRVFLTRTAAVDEHDRDVVQGLSSGEVKVKP